MKLKDEVLANFENNDAKFIKRGCTNESCYCTGKCTEVIGERNLETGEVTYYGNSFFSTPQKGVNLGINRTSTATPSKPPIPTTKGEVMSFEEFMQDQVGAGYPLRDILNNLTDEQITEDVDNYIMYINKNLEDKKLFINKDGNEYCCTGEGFIDLQQSDNYSFSPSISQAINTFPNNIVKEPRYIIDNREGCIVVRDRKHPSYSIDNLGLYSYTLDIVFCRIGYIVNGERVVDKEDILLANSLADILNKIEDDRRSN